MIQKREHSKLIAAEVGRTRCERIFSENSKNCVNLFGILAALWVFLFENGYL